MSFGEEIIRLRQRVNDAIKKGIIADVGKEIFEATLLQIMNDAERNRQNCVTQAENLRRQAGVMDGQAAAFASVSSIIFNVINGFVVVAERAEEEEKRLREEAESNKEGIQAALKIEQEQSVIEDKKATSKKKR